MQKEVQMGQIETGKNEDVLIAPGIGSCLVIALYDSKQKIGALAHTMLPARRMSATADYADRKTADYAEESRRSRRLQSAASAVADTRYADTAIDEMLKRIDALGAKREDLEAKLIGGANMFSAFTSKIGEDNISYARKKLQNAGITIVGECVGGSQGRSVEFSVATGIVTVKTKF